MKYPARLLMIVCSVWWVPLCAQESTGETEVRENAVIMQEALSLRAEMAAAISSETERTEDALERLRGASYPSGLRISPEAGFGYAALDVGQRLMVLDKMTEAAVFLEAAETALATQVRQMPDTQAKEKAQYLRKLALIRGNYLNKPAQAREDIDAAIQLQSEDRQLQRFRTVLVSDKADLSKSTTENEEAGK